MLRIFRRRAKADESSRRGRVLSLLLIAIGSGRFWAVTALAATVAAVSVVLYLEIHAEPGDAGSYGYQTLGRERVLLMNVDNNAACPVTFEGYDYNESKSLRQRRGFEAFWTFVETDTISLYNLKANSSTELHVSDNGEPGERLWSLLHCRHGNTYSSSDAAIRARSNYLPFSATSLGINSTSTAASNKATDNTAGQIVMQNTPEAQVVSSCYPDGIGTIYFDAVNGFDDYKLGVIEVDVAYGVFKTNLTGQVESRRIPEDLELDADGNFVPPDEEHCDEIRYTQPDVTETTPFGRIAWIPVRLTGTWHCNGTTGTIPTNTTLALEMPISGTAGSKENFYRVWAPVADSAVNPHVSDYARGPMRFRLKRLDDPRDNTPAITFDGETFSTVEYKAKNGLLLVDNVIASYPPMKAWAVPGGDYVSSGSLRNAIGWTGVVTPVKYPAVGVTGLKAAAGLQFATNNPPVDVSGWIAKTTASLTYRWRYLDQIIEPWQQLALEMDGDRLVSVSDLALPSKVGDVEFSYDVELDAPYYAYLDYSGSTALAGTPGYLERIKRVTSRLNPDARGAAGGVPLQLPSGGKDFFFRLREGQSDQLEFQLELRRLGATATQTNALFLTGNGTWKTYVKVTTNEQSRTALLKGDYEFRIVGVDPAKIFGGTDVTELPWSGKPLYAATGDQGWTKITFDAVTGALMFQVMETEDADFMTYTVVRADFQDFSYWNDAASAATPPLYTGAYFEGRGKQSGSSPDARDYPSEFGQWSATGSSNVTYWTERFVPDLGKNPNQGYSNVRAYVPFTKKLRTPNGWQTWNAQWVCGKYRESPNNGDMALQLMGDGSGVLEFSSASRAPRGLDAITFDARIAQAQTFDGFTYYFGDALNNMKDYIFVTRAVMRTGEASTEFEGAGSISLVGYYQPGEGCYELRAERLEDNRVRLYLYKWRRDGKSIKATLLGYQNNTLSFYDTRSGTPASSHLRSSNNGASTTEQEAAFYGELYMRCRTVGGEAIIETGVMYAAKRLAESTSGANHYCFYYRDTTANNPLTYGTFGFSSLNCPAQIINPQYYANGTEGTFPASTTLTQKPKNQDGADISNAEFANCRCGTGNVTYPPGGTSVFIGSGTATKYDNWTFNSDRYSLGRVNNLPAAFAVPPSGEVALYTWPSGGSSESEASAGTVAVDGFKTNKGLKITVRNREETLLRLTTTDGSDDIVVDNVQFNQWCAANYDDNDNSDFYSKVPNLGCPTNYVYLNGWVSITGALHTVDLQPMRARSGQLLSVRAPLMDGNDGRGVGLGQFSFTYRNADAHCVLKVQYCELATASYLKESTSGTNDWVDVQTIDFSQAEWLDKRDEGSVSVYVGEHNLKGVMRVIVDPQVVIDSQNATKNPTCDVDYGRITLTSCRASDEPPLDGRSWWGWNLRTSDDPADLSIYDSLATQARFSLALNNDLLEDTEPVGEETDTERERRFAQHVPFVQSPTFATNLVGEISFKARKLRPTDPDTQVAVLGAKDGGVSLDSQWECLEVIVITNATFAETYSYKTQPGQDYASFRLAVIGVGGVSVNYSDRMKIDSAQRVLIDDVAISEAVRAKLAIRDVAAFRTGLDNTACLLDILDKSQQPLCREPWGVQGEVYVAQLADEIDMDVGFRVNLHWYFGTVPWGFSGPRGWLNAPGAKSAPLAQVTSGAAGRYVYRSSYADAPDAVVSPVTTNCVIQYALEVLYRPKGVNTWATNWITRTDWTAPSWYRGVNYNSGEAFSPYTIIDTVAPGYAWINEINVFGTYVPVTWANTDANRQYVEVGMPRSADLTGWKLRFLSPNLQSGVVVTNDAVTFGLGGMKATKDRNVASNCVFLVAACPGARKNGGTLDEAKGEVDGYWRLPNKSGAFSVDEAIVENTPVGMQLVRPSGIIEHELLMLGTNVWEGSAQLENQFDPQSYIDFFRTVEPGADFVYAGKEHGGDPNSLGVFTQLGTASNQWTHAMVRTPGRINEGQQLPFDTPPTPFGSALLIYANLGPSGRVAQILNEGEFRTSQMIVLQKGGPGTNLVYRVDPWHEMGSLTTNGQAAAWRTTGPRTYEILVGAGSSNDTITVEADAVMDRRLAADHGLTPDNPYTPAVLAWLTDGKDLYGNDWADPTSGAIYPALFWPHSGEAEWAHLLDLTTMYWLDIDPTREGWVLDAGTTKIEILPRDAKGKENVRIGTFMVISNRAEQADWPEHLKAHAPYALRGLAPGESSLDYSQTSPNVWTSATFKVVGFLNNGLTVVTNKTNWIPVRWFVFNAGSFGAKGTPEAYTAEVDVDDPWSKDSPGEWLPWYEKYGTKPGFFWYWRIDDYRRPRAPEILTPHATLP